MPVTTKFPERWWLVRFLPDDTITRDSPPDHIKRQLAFGALLVAAWMANHGSTSKRLRRAVSARLAKAPADKRRALHWYTALTHWLEGDEERSLVAAAKGLGIREPADKTQASQRRKRSRASRRKA